MLIGIHNNNGDRRTFVYAAQEGATASDLAGFVMDMLQYDSDFVLIKDKLFRRDQVRWDEHDNEFPIPGEEPFVDMQNPKTVYPVPDREYTYSLDNAEYYLDTWIGYWYLRQAYTAPNPKQDMVIYTLVQNEALPFMKGDNWNRESLEALLVHLKAKNVVPQDAMIWHTVL